MARICDICGKTRIRGQSIVRKGIPKKKGGIGTKVTGISRRWFVPNIRKVRAIMDGVPKRISICAKCLKAGKVQKVVHQHPAPLAQD
ncbi:MAG: 50S ribosomal protein L28 [Candidatus Omnitrophica bacterium]|nr:50S ribosomal protein L28 [Candidatus Omnitrophota bacterium]